MTCTEHAEKQWNKILCTGVAPDEHPWSVMYVCALDHWHNDCRIDLDTTVVFFEMRFCVLPKNLVKNITLMLVVNLMLCNTSSSVNIWKIKFHFHRLCVCNSAILGWVGAITHEYHKNTSFHKPFTLDGIICTPLQPFMLPGFFCTEFIYAYSSSEKLTSIQYYNTNFKITTLSCGTYCAEG